MSAKHEFQVPQNGRPRCLVFTITTRFGARGESLKSSSDFPNSIFKCHYNDKSKTSRFNQNESFSIPYCFAFNFSKVCTKIRVTGVVLKISSWVISKWTNQYGSYTSKRSVPLGRNDHTWPHHLRPRNRGSPVRAPSRPILCITVRIPGHFPYRLSRLQL